MKSRSSDNIIYAKLFIELCKTRQSLVDLYFFILTKKQTPLQLNCRYSKANNFSQVVPWPVEDYHRTYYIHILQVAQGMGFDILIRNYL